jgi:cysteine desulfurase / selenocysteine lyase
VLALPSKILDRQPVDPGGGSIDMISDKDIVWAPPEVRHQTGTWNVTGIIATAASCKALMDFGWSKLFRHEKQLVKYATRELSTVPGIVSYIPWEKYNTEDRIGTITFNLPKYHHALLSATLEHEYGIETRAGTICNHRLVRRWNKVTNADQKRIEREIKSGNRLASYGIVRISLGLHNTKKDIDDLVKALKNIAVHGPKLEYKPVPKEEIYVPKK